MFDADNWKEIFETIQKNKLRTFLSGFTVALGILIFVVLYGLGNGLQNTFNKFFQDDATNVFFIFPGRTTMPYKGYKSDRTIEFKNGDVAAIEKNFPTYIEYISPRIFRSANVSFGRESNNYTTRAVAPSYQFAEKTTLMKGRFINDADVKARSKYVVIGRLVEKDLFKGSNAIGQYINVGGIMFRVIGVFQDDGGDNEERYLYLPYTTRQLLEKNNDKVDDIVIGFKPEIGYDEVMKFDGALDRFIRELKYIAPMDRSGIYIRNVADQLKQNQQFAQVLQIIVSLVAIGTIIAGIIGISNIMVFVVKERTKELGIRKALGATPRDVVGTILLESTFITTVSGFVGLILGVAILNSLRDKLEGFFITNPYIDMGTAIFATVLLIFFGAIAGYIPARRAANIKPIVALRDE